MLSLVLAIGSLVPAGEPPPPHLQYAFAVVNRERRALGKPALKWSSRLAASAQELTDHGWAVYQTDPTRFDRACLRWDWERRARRYGARAEIGIGGSSAWHGDDGRVYPLDADGFAHPWRFPENAVREMLGLRPAAMGDDYTHVGIGWTGGMAAIDFGSS